MKTKSKILFISIITIISFIVGVSYAYFTTIVIGNDSASSNTPTLDSIIAPKVNIWDNTEGYFWDYKEEITSITFEDEIAVSTDAIKSWDVSLNQNKNIMAFIIDDGQENNTYELFIQSKGDILANSNSSKYFKDFKLLNQINNLSLLKTHLVTDMSDMFNSCFILFSLNLSSFETSNVENMSGMFNLCKKLTLLDLTNFDTSKVYDMSLMFSSCEKLTLLDLTNFDTSKVYDMSLMFSSCEKLTSLDLTNFDTSEVTDMGGMFSDCNNLETLNLSSFDTSSVIYMSEIFARTSSLTNINFDKAIFSDSEEYNEYCLFIDTNSNPSIIVNDPTSYAWIIDKYNNRETEICKCYGCEE